MSCCSEGLTSAIYLVPGLFKEFQNFWNSTPARCLTGVGSVVLPTGLLPNYHSFCCVILLWLIIALGLFVYVLVECVLWYSRWLIFASSILTLNFRKLGKTFTETREMMKNVYGDHCMSHTRYEWLRDLRTVGNQHMMSHVWYGPQCYVTTLMSLRSEQTVNHWYYLEVLKCLRENVRRKRPLLWRNNSWFLHHDNVPAHNIATDS
jgi:hypothetical protein